MKKLLGIIVLSLLYSAGAFALCNKKYGKTSYAPPGGTEVSAKWKSNYSITYQRRKC